MKSIPQASKNHVSGGLQDNLPQGKATSSVQKKTIRSLVKSLLGKQKKNRDPRENKINRNIGNENDLQFISRLENTEHTEAPEYEALASDRTRLIQLMIRNLIENKTLYTGELANFQGGTFIKIMFGSDAKDTFVKNFATGKYNSKKSISEGEGEFIMSSIGNPNTLTNNPNGSIPAPEDHRETINAVKFNGINLIDALKQSGIQSDNLEGEQRTDSHSPRDDTPQTLQ